MLIGLIAVLVEGGRTRARLPRLRNLGVDRGGHEQQDGGEGVKGDHARKMAPDARLAKRGLERFAQAVAERAQTRVRLTQASSSSRVVGTAYSASRSKPSFGK